MTKEDYREKVEEHRQEIDLHNEPDAKLSRAGRHQKKGKKKQSNPIMTLLVVVLIFIPLSILGYVWFVYEPSASQSEKVDVDEKNDDVVVEIVKQDQDSTNSAADDKDDEEKADDAKDKSTDADKNADLEKERLAAEAAKKAEEKDAEEAKKAEEAQKVAAQKAKELEEKKKAEEAAKAQKKTHTVQSTDNLYRIAIKYYGDGSTANIEKIKSANNLSSDSISTGQVLVILP